MFAAQEARNISNKAYKEQIDAELASIVPEIEAAMRKGEYSCWIYETNISLNLLNLSFISNTFVVSSFSNTPFLTIALKCCHVLQ